MSASLTSLPLFPEPQSGPLGSGIEDSDESPRRDGRGRRVAAACIVLSLVLHVLGVWLADFRPAHRLILDRLLVLDIAAPLVKPAPPPAPAETQAAPPPPAATSRPKPAPQPRTAKTPSPEAAVPKKEHSAPAPRSGAGTEHAPLPQRGTGAPAAAGAGTPIGQVASRPGVTVLANESGQDALKHGSEARFMHGVATEEFVEDNYVGEYAMGKLGRVWIEDDRARSGHLILHAEHMDFRRPLFRFNRFIYVYGQNPDSPEPILGSVTFFSDGYHIHQFLWQHNATYAYYPRRD